MIETLKYEIKKILMQEKKYVSNSTVYINLLFLFNLKYLCDIGLYTYDELLQIDNLEKLNLTEENRLLSFGNYKVRKLLPIIKYEDLKVLVKEYMTMFEKKPKFIPSDKNILILSTEFSYSLYDECGNTTYITDFFNENSLGFAVFKFFDKVLSLNNKYMKINDIKFSDYEYMYVYEFMPKYRFIKNDASEAYKYVHKILKINKEIKIILHTDFKKISNMREHSELLNYLDKVLLYDEINTYMLFKNKIDENISIIKYNKDKIKSFDRLKEIIENNRKIKDILIKTTITDIIKNHYRIGFKLYQDRLKIDSRNINEIVDENTNLIDELTSLNKTIEVEINKLINR